MQFPRERTKERIDQMWLYTVRSAKLFKPLGRPLTTFFPRRYILQVLAAIGETFEVEAGADKEVTVPTEQSDMITGVIINVRPNL